MNEKEKQRQSYQDTITSQKYRLQQIRGEQRHLRIKLAKLNTEHSKTMECIRHNVQNHDKLCEIPFDKSRADAIMTVDEACRYCGGTCPSKHPDSENLCDGFAGDIDELYQAD